MPALRAAKLEAERAAEAERLRAEEEVILIII
jgi:hypothetical protein